MTSSARRLSPARSAAATALTLLLLTPLLLGWSWGRAWWKTRQGNQLYAQAQELERQQKQGEAVKKYQEALQRYRDALVDDPTAPGIPLNIGNVYYKQRKFKQAVKEYEKVLQSDDARLQAEAHYNIGNCRFQQGDFVKAIESYKRALDLNPDDKEAKYNLELARQRLKDLANKQKDQQRKNQNQTRNRKHCQTLQGAGKKNPKGTKKNNSETAQKQQDRKTSKSKAKQQPQQGKKAKPSAGEKKPTGKAKAVKMSREEAERLLRSLEADEKEAMKQSLRLPVPDNPEYHGADY